jgi:hypothetical protein
MASLDSVEVPLTVRRLLSGLGILLATAVASADGGQVAWTRSALSRLPLSKGDREPERAELHAKNLDVFSQEIARVSARAPLPPQKWASLLGAIGGIESNFDTEIVAGRCPKWACDHGRAKGAFQNQNVGPVSDLWPVADNNPRVQVAMADRMLRRTWKQCERFAPFPASVFRGYSGHGCHFPVHREAERVAAYQRLLATPMAVR